MIEGAHKYRLIVFDWDGTLMDSQRRIVEAMQRAASAVKLDPPGTEQVREIIGLGLPQAIQTLYPRLATSFRERMIEHYRLAFVDPSAAPQRLFPGVRDGLVRLHAAGYRLAVATGKSRRGLDRALRETGTEALFAASRCADETLSKPHPQMLVELMEELAHAPEDTIMVGDTEYDLAMAQRAGTDSLGVTYGAHDRGRLKRYRPERLSDSFSEVVEWLLSPG